jgi:hypothetical protein
VFILNIKVFWCVTLWASGSEVSIFLSRLTVQTALRYFETSATTRPTTERHIPEEVNLQQHCCLSASRAAFIYFGHHFIPFLVSAYINDVAFRL